MNATNNMHTLLRGDLYPVMLEESVETRLLPAAAKPGSHNSLCDPGPWTRERPAKLCNLALPNPSKAPKLLHVGQLATPN